MVDIRELVDVENGRQHRRIFWDREIYELELERVFARCWLFLTHESLIPEVGDFVVTKMGEDEVVVLRQREGSIRAFLNQCTHRGMKLCPAEAGNARGFACPYHGWGFGIDGQLNSVPMQEQIYGPDFDRGQLGLREVPLVDSHRGFVFACMDASAPPLLDFLGDSAWYMDIWADVPGGVELVGPPSRSIIHCNWKTPTENFVGDSYHVGWTHSSALKAAVGSSVPHAAFLGEPPSFQTTSRYGHGLGVHADWLGAMLLAESCPEILEALAIRQAKVEPEKGARAAKLVTGAWDASFFPNCSYLFGTNIFKVWHPLGPDRVEVMSWAIADANFSDDAKQRVRSATHRVFGTAGILESDDIDNFEYTTKPNRGYVTRQGWLNCQMGLGREREDDEFPGIVGDYINELAARGFYRFYADCLSSTSWGELEATTASWKEDILRRASR